MRGSNSFPFPVTLQTVLPPDFETNDGFARLAETISELGLWGVELNVADLGDPRVSDVSAVRRYLSRYGLELSMFASGLTAKTLGLSLSHTNDAERRVAVEWTRRMIAWLAGGTAGAGRESREQKVPEAGIIIGYLKGGTLTNPADARAQLVISLAELAPAARKAGVPLILEATNRYESAVVNSVEQGARVVDDAARAASLSAKDGRKVLRVLPDTFHMNIEERGIVPVLEAFREYYSSVHLSDNNRFFPGFGAIDFGPIIRALQDGGYQGRLGIEGNVQKGELEDLRRSVDYLKARVT